MKRTLMILMLLSLIITETIRATELHLAEIKNSTNSSLTWEKLPIPGMLGKMQPITIEKNDMVQPNLLMRPPVTLSFSRKNRLLGTLRLSLTTTTLKGGPHFREAPGSLRRTHLSMILKDRHNKVIREWAEEIVSEQLSYALTIKLDGKNLKDTTISLMSHEIPMPLAA